MTEPRPLSRRAVIVSAAGLAASPAFAQPPAATPVALNIMDVAGKLQLTKVGIERFRAANPALVSRITYGLAPSPELPGKLKAQQ